MVFTLSLNRAKKNILLVDDDEDILFCYEALLDHENIELYSACNAEDALDIMEDVKIDVAILDYMLPTCNGDRLAQLIHEVYPDTSIYIISGVYDVDEALDNIGVNVKEVMKKPVDPDELEHIILSECQLVQ
jgi:DNA-binding NtrC family response regulator